MRFRIIDRDGFYIVGERVFVKSEESSLVIPALWDNMSKEASEGLAALNSGEQRGFLGVCGDMYNDGFDYWLAVESDKHDGGYEEMYIPPLTWAVFEAYGPMPLAIQSAWERIYSDWLPTSGYVHADAPEFEWYSEGDKTSVDYYSEIWIPIESGSLDEDEDEDFDDDEDDDDEDEDDDFDENEDDDDEDEDDDDEDEDDDFDDDEDDDDEDDDFDDD